MVNFTRINNKDFVSAIEFHELLDLSRKHFNRNINSWVFETDYLFQDEIEITFPRINIDYIILGNEEKKTNFRQELLISKELSKLIAINSKSYIKKQYVQWLLRQETKIENYDYLTIEQVLYLIDLVNCFKFITHQKAAEKYHKDKYIENKLGQNEKIKIEFAAKLFNKYRTKLLDIKSDDLKERLKRFFDTDNKYKNPKNRRDIIYLLDKFGLIKIAVFDFLSAAKKPSETALKVGELAKQIAKRMDVEFRQDNIPDLFNPEKEVINPEMLHRISSFLKTQKKLK